MIKLKINTFKHGLFWYMCCEIPEEEHECFYYDNAPFSKIYSPITLHIRALTYKKAYEKINNKLEEYFEEKPALTKLDLKKLKTE